VFNSRGQGIMSSSPESPDELWVSHSLLYEWATSRGIKQPGREAVHSPYDAEVSNGGAILPLPFDS
jgi:hypothetical protein